jgi:prolyl-tRNA synthetase
MFLKLYLISLPIFFLIDMLWLGFFAKNFYAKHLGFLMTKNIIWPAAIAPFHVHIASLDPADPEVKAISEKLYDDLHRAGFEVLMDDREERPGVKFKDADLLGMPVRVNIGARGVKAGEIEIITRRTKAMNKVKVDQALAAIQTTLRELATV